MIDRARLQVTRAARLEMNLPSTRRVLLLGSRVSFPVTALDGQGRRLHGQGAIDIETPAGFERVTEYRSDLDHAFSGTDHGVFRALALGPATIGARLGNLSASDEVEVIAEDAVASIELLPEETRAERGEVAIFTLARDSGETFVYGGHCDWEVDATAPVRLELPRADELAPSYPTDLELTLVRSNDAGTAILTCTIGPASWTSVIEFP